MTETKCAIIIKIQIQYVSKEVFNLKNEILINLRGKTPRLAVAKALGITPQGLGMIERGERIPRPNLMKRIANYYAKTVDELFFYHNRHKMCQNHSSMNNSFDEISNTVSKKSAG